jgi:hypothetical protein
MILLTVGTLLSPPRKACVTETGWLPQMAINLNDWTKELEVELTMLAFDMWATQKRLEEKGFRVASGNKTPTGWCLTANKRNRSYGNIKVQSDGTKIAVTVEGWCML